MIEEWVITVLYIHSDLTCHCQMPCMAPGCQARQLYSFIQNGLWDKDLKSLETIKIPSEREFSCSGYDDRVS